MKKLGKIKLNQLEKVDLKKREMEYILGGDDCDTCACAFGEENKVANDNYGYSQSGGSGYCACGCEGCQDPNDPAPFSEVNGNNAML